MSDPARNPLERSSRPQMSLVSSGSSEPYRRLAEIFHDVLSEQSLDALLERIADTLAELIPYEDVHIYEADEAKRELIPVLARSKWADEVMRERFSYGEGITGWAVERREPVLANKAHLDPRVRFVPGTPVEPEALIAVPLIARGRLKGTLNIYRVGEDAEFSEEEFLLATRFGDAAALALDNAHIRARLEHQASTDALTGLYNHRAFHDRLRHELRRASAEHDSVALVMLDLDDFKKVNDIYGHGVGDQLLVQVADVLHASVRASDAVCRIGGEEFAIIIPSGDVPSSVALAERLGKELEKLEADAAGSLTVSTGIAVGPEHAANPRELVACAEAAMMTAKSRGDGLVVAFDETTRERPSTPGRLDDVRSIAHLKMLQSLSGKLSRLNDVAQIGITIADELRLLIDYHNCRVFLRDGNDLLPVAFRGDLTAAEPGTSVAVLPTKVGRGVTGRVAETGEPLLVGDAAHCEFGEQIAGTVEIEESLLAVPLTFGSRVTGVIVISQLGLDQFDADDLRVLEVLAAHASVALENARLYEAQKREAELATALLELGRELGGAHGAAEAARRIVGGCARILSSPSVSLLLQEEESGGLVRIAEYGAARSQAVDRRVPPGMFLDSWLERAGPFIVETSAEHLVLPDAGAPTEHVRRRALPHRRAPRGDRRGTPGRRGVRGARAGASRRDRTAGEARVAERRELREARADLPLDGGGADQRAGGQRRADVDPRSLDRRPRGHGRRQARARVGSLEASRVRRTAPRHRETGCSRSDPDEAGAADDRRARGRRGAPDPRRAHPGADRAARGGPAHHP